MSQSQPTDTQLEKLLSAVTDAMLADKKANVDAIIGQYDVPRADVDNLVSLIQRLHMTMIGVQPSRRFVRRLKHDLVGQQRRDVIATVRYLPPRVQIAAGVAFVLGFMLLSRRQMLLYAAREKQPEVTPAQ
jgi:hypothetical protein